MNEENWYVALITVLCTFMILFCLFMAYQIGSIITIKDIVHHCDEYGKFENQNQKISDLYTCHLSREE